MLQFLEIISNIYVVGQALAVNKNKIVFTGDYMTLFNYFSFDWVLIINCFFIYSFMGWILEVIVTVIEDKKIENRGFVHGPICTVYGAGAILISLALGRFENNVSLLFMASMAFATFFEFITAKLMCLFFGTFWWNYSAKPFNYKGIICLQSTIGWGILTIIYFKLIKPSVEGFVLGFPFVPRKQFALIILTLYIIDFIYSFYKALNKTEDPNNRGIKINIGKIF